MKLLLFLFLLLLLHLPIFSWSNHSHGTYLSLAELNSLKDIPNVKVEKLEAFLKKEKVGIQKLIQEQEDFLYQNLKDYPPKPKGLEFAPSDDSKIVIDFLRSLRLNPDIKLAYYIQELPGTEVPEKQKFPIKDVTIFKQDEWMGKHIFSIIKDGQEVKPIFILSTASDEPDYGHDVGLYEDNNTEIGKLYGFGEQPFGDPKLEYSSQAPFHMGFYYESSVIYALAKFLKKTLPEYRIYQFWTLSKFAFQTGHPYWGYRFAGWAMHYLQDITQPYHTRVLPNYGTFRMISIDLLSGIGLNGSKQKAIQRASDRHLSIENYQYISLIAHIAKKEETNPLLVAFKGLSRDSTYPEFSFNYPREVIAKQANSRVDELDSYIDDWTSLLEFKDYSYPLEKLDRGEASKKVDILLIELMQNFASHTRNFYKSCNNSGH